MSFFSIRLGGLLGVSALTTVGSWYIYDANYPKTLGKLFEWKGGVLAKDDLAFKAIFEEKKKLVSKLKIDDLSESVDVNQAIQKIRDWCGVKLSFELEDVTDDLREVAFDFCVDSYKTLKGSLIRKGLTLIDKDEDYKVVFALYRGTSEFASWLNGVSSDSIVSAEYSKLKKKCQEDLEKNLGDISLSEFNGASWWCVVSTEKTIGELLEKDKVKIIADGSTDDSELWKKQFEGWRSEEEIIRAIKEFKGENSNLLNTTPGSEGGPKMKTWCEESKSKNLGDDGVYPKIYSQIKSVCTRKLEIRN